MTHEPTSFWSRYVFSQDHKVIGIQYIVTGFAMAFLGGFLAMLMRLQLAWPEGNWPIFGKLMADGVMAPELYIAIVTMHGTIMVFFFISYALVSGFGNYLIPIQIGAKDMAYPLLNMLSYWVAFLSVIVLLLSFFAEGGAAASGWTAYPPLSALESAVPGSGMGQTLWLLAMALFIVSFTMGGLNFIATIFCMRAPGLSMSRLPLTVWSYLISTVLGVLAFPALTAGAIMLLFDRHAGTSFYLPAGLVVSGEALLNEGGTPLLWQHLFWFLGHPEVYVLILPAIGIVFEILPAFTRKPVYGSRLTVWSYIGMGTLGMIVWAHHMFVSGMSPFSGEYFSVATLLITIPATIIGINMLASLWGGKIQLKTPMLFAIGLIALFGGGGLGGLFLGNATADIQLHDTYFVVGHFHLMIGGVTLLGLYGAIYFWFPKMFGRMLNERLGKIHFWLTFVCYYTIFVLQHFVGLTGMPRRYYAFTDYEFLQEALPYNVFISWFAFVMGISQLIFVVNVVYSLRKGEKAPVNPWQATTLEWTLPSPPPHGNWGSDVPRVHRWAYEYSADGAEDDYTLQTVPGDQVAVTR